VAAQTWTLDVAGLVYIDVTGKAHTITTNETFKLTFTDTGDGGTFQGLEGGGEVECSDGFSFLPECDGRFKFDSSVDLSASINNGELCFVEDGFNRHVWSVISLTMANADGTGANNITTMTLESKVHGRQVIWTNINTV